MTSTLSCFTKVGYLFGVNTTRSKSTSRKYGLICFSILTALVLGSCSSEPKAPEIPAWTHQPSRTVDAGYIVYVASSEDRSPEKAHFKAQSVAFEDLANECSFPPKGARTEDTFDTEKTGILHTVYVKVAVDFQSCEEAKNATQPEDIRKLANVAMTDQIKSYQNQYESPPKEMVEACNTDDGLTPVDSDPDGDDCDVSPQTQQVLNSQNAPRVAYISSPTQYYVVGQQVWYAKQTVILSPPTAYQPNTPQATAFSNQIATPVKQMSTYAAANPAIKSSPQTWSTTRQAAVQNYRGTQTAQRAQTQRAQNRSNRGRSNGQRRGNGQHRRRKRQSGN
jgi:hypothetical protein